MMIKYSDNSAAVILNQYITPEQFKKAYLDLGIEIPSNQQYSVSVRTYASFFRILFNATYLSRELSEKALQILSQSTFKDGLRGGVPSNITIAHKFGERGTEEYEKQLHDCGIVYYPEKPYLLCVMTRGKDFEKLGQAIQSLSRIIYEKINN